MPKVSVYLPDELYDEVRSRNLPLSAITQRAVEQAVRVESVNEWVAEARSRPRRVQHPVSDARMAEIWDEVDEEFGA
jgi:post-segregation antitoxin (ccd killing protein)